MVCSGHKRHFVSQGYLPESPSPLSVSCLTASCCLLMGGPPVAALQALQASQSQFCSRQAAHLSTVHRPASWRARACKPITVAAAAAEPAERLRLNNLSPQEGARQKERRKGRGYGGHQVRCLAACRWTLPPSGSESRCCEHRRPCTSHGRSTANWSLWQPPMRPRGHQCEGLVPATPTREAPVQDWLLWGGIVLTSGFQGLHHHRAAQ